MLLSLPKVLPFLLIKIDYHNAIIKQAAKKSRIRLRNAKEPQNESSPPSAGCSCFASSWLPSFRWGRTVKVGAVCKTAPLALDCPSNPAALTVCAQRNTIPTSEDAMETTPVRSSKRVSDHHVSFIYTNGCFMDFRL